MVNLKLGRITKTLFKRKSPEKGFVPKIACTKSNFTAYRWRVWELLYCFLCEMHYCAPSWPKCCFFKNSGINISFAQYDFHEKYIAMSLGVAIKVETYHCAYSLVKIVLWTPSWPEHQKHPQKWQNTFENEQCWIWISSSNWSYQTVLLHTQIWNFLHGFKSKEVQNITFEHTVNDLVFSENSLWQEIIKYYKLETIFSINSWRGYSVSKKLVKLTRF